MQTFQDNYELCQRISGDKTAERLAQFKNDINDGFNDFLTKLGRKVNREYLKTGLVANQQYYQMPPDCLKVSELQTLNGTTWENPTLITSEERWNELNQTVQKGNSVEFYYIRGFNEIGLFPIPSGAVTTGLSISYEPAGVFLSQPDFTTGTLTVNNNSTAITHSAGGFLPQMVGRWLQVNDGTDGRWYRVASYTSTTILNLENFYNGISGAGRTFRLGEAFKLPGSFQNVGPYHALDMYFQSQNDDSQARSYEQRIETLLKEARKAFARSTTHIGSNQRPTRHGDPRRFWIDRTKSVTYP